MIYLMCGIPGSGKSYFIQKNMTQFDYVISRDSIRFNLLEPGQDYFKHEKEVLSTFKKNIREVTSQKDMLYNVWIDATHNTKKSRRQVLECIPKGVPVTCVYFRPDLKKSFTNDAKRTGRQAVGQEVITTHFSRHEPPEFSEGFTYILEVL